MSVAGIPAAEFEERRERLLDQVRQVGASGYVLFDAAYIQYFTGFWFLSNERPVVFAESTSGESAIFVPEFEVARTRAETAFDRIEAYPRVPGCRAPDDDSGACARRPWDRRRDRSRPGRLSRDPRLPGTAAERGHGRIRLLGRGCDRADARAQERQRDRADPRERTLVRARGTGCCRSTRGPA
jgi:hypothetical protein